MANHDLSRHLFRPANRYTGLRMQQGRTMLDSDFSEGEMLDDEDRRAVAVDVIGPHGSPDMGFEIRNAAAHVYDFDILSGSYYLGGLRHEIVGTAVVAGATADPTAGAGTAIPQRFRAQTDWLQASRSDARPQPPTLPVEARRDLVYLVGWEQTVSAVEDREFHEMALGGPDTAVRVWRGHRVYVRSGVPEGCHEAFEALVESLEAGGHRFDRVHHELKSGARLTVVIDEAAAGDLCEPAIPPGYSGVENQAIRVQMIARDRVLWGYDNAAPLYRARTSVEANATIVEFLTQPRDQAHHPAAGQVLEILPFGARLANGEYTADLPIADDIGGGVLARVLDGYDPVRRTVKVQVESAAALAAMTAWFAANDVPPDRRCFYVRVWNPGDGSRSGPIGLAFKPAQEVALPGTGLRIEFNHGGIVGDHWIIAARPSTPTEVVPWTLRSGEAPHGPRRFYAPLALLHWTYSAAFGRAVTVDSCRRTFRPLTRQKGCCTVTVGDESRSFGDFTSITAALAAIPVDQPAKICVLPGVYSERVVIHGRSHLVVEGCGASTILRTPAASNTVDGLVAISSSHDITLKDLTIEASGQFGVKVADSFVTYSALPPQRRIRLEGLTITSERGSGLPAPTLEQLHLPATGAAPFPMSTIAAFHVEDLLVRDCVTTMAGDLSGAPNLCLVECRAVTVRGNRIRTADNKNAERFAWGGVQVGARCERVLIEDNRIEGGSGYGITLGTGGAWGEVPGDLDIFDPVGRFVLVQAQGGYNAKASLVETAVPSGGGEAIDVTYEAECRDVRVLRNTITGMGSSGISTLGFFKEPADTSAGYETLRTYDLEIADNVIRGNCAYRFQGAPIVDYAPYAAVGGIVLADADDLRIRANAIAGTGADETIYPVCGIYVMYGENVAVEDNRVTDNGKHGTDTPVAGHRSGIGLMMVGRRVTGAPGSATVAGDLLMPAARVRGNVVHHPLGKALQLYGIGPMFVEGNVFVAKARGVVLSEDDTGRCVDVHNLGQSPELVESGTIPSDLGFLPAPPLPWDPALPTLVDPMLVDGRVLFAGNQVRYSPSATEANNIRCVNRFQSYGDVAVLGNQFFVQFPATSGSLTNDTTVVAWSTRTADNRWVDPATVTPYETDASATTAARMNITALNQATRCIHVVVGGTLPLIDSNPVDHNQILTVCEGDEELEALLMPPP